MALIGNLAVRLVSDSSQLHADLARAHGAMDVLQDSSTELARTMTVNAQTMIVVQAEAQRTVVASTLLSDTARKLGTDTKFTSDIMMAFAENTTLGKAACLALIPVMGSLSNIVHVASKGINMLSQGLDTLLSVATKIAVYTGLTMWLRGVTLHAAAASSAVSVLSNAIIMLGLKVAAITVVPLFLAMAYTAEKTAQEIANANGELTMWQRALESVSELWKKISNIFAGGFLSAVGSVVYMFASTVNLMIDGVAEINRWTNGWAAIALKITAVSLGIAGVLKTLVYIRSTMTAIWLITKKYTIVQSIIGFWKGVAGWVSTTLVAQTGLSVATVFWMTVLTAGAAIAVVALAGITAQMTKSTLEMQNASNGMKELTANTKEYYETLKNGANNITTSLLTPLEKLQQRQRELLEMQQRADEAPNMIKNLQQVIQARQRLIALTESRDKRGLDISKLPELKQIQERDQAALKAIQDFVASMPNAGQMQAELAKAQQEYFKSFGIDQIFTAQETRDAAIKNLDAAMGAGAVSLEQYHRHLERINDTFAKNDAATQEKIRSEQEYANTLARYSAMIATPAENYAKAMDEFSNFAAGKDEITDTMRAAVENKLQEQFASSLGLSDVLKAMASSADEYAQRLELLTHFAEATGQSQEWLTEAQDKLRKIMDDKAKQEEQASMRSNNAALIKGSAAAYKVSYESQHGNKQVEASKRIENEQKKGNNLAEKGNGILSNLVAAFKSGGTINFQTYNG